VSVMGCRLIWRLILGSEGGNYWNMEKRLLDSGGLSVLDLITIFYGFEFRALLATPLRMPQVVESPTERTAG
jgi:hypothetical protein